MNGNQPPEPMSKACFWGTIFPILVSLCIVLFLLLLAEAQYEDEMMTFRAPHPLDWIAKYSGRRMGCCGHTDCLPVNMRIIAGSQRENGGQTVVDVEYFLKVGNVGPFIIQEFPLRAIFASEDELDYFCFVPGNWSHTPGSIYKDPCVESPQLECSNCFFFSPKT